MRYKILFILLFICFAYKASSQDPTLPPTEEQLSLRSKNEFAYAKVSFNIPKQFHRVKLTDANYGQVFDKTGGGYIPLDELITNKDTSLAIGVYVAKGAERMDMKANAKKRLYYVDTLAVDFILYNKERLAIWHTDFGVEYPEKVQLFMGRFTDARVIQIADFDRELRIVYFFTEKQRENTAAIIKETQNIVTPIVN